MKLNAGLHLAYCTNVHRCETWAETFESLKNCTLRVRDRVCPHRPYGIGLSLSNRAAQELSDFTSFREFRRWLDHHHCYVFTINGFSFGQFRGHRIREQVYEPDWRSPERLAYTNRLVDLLSQLVPPEVEGSITTLPGSFKGFNLHADEIKAIRVNLWHCVEHIARVSEATGRKLHLGLEPEPLCLLESSGEILQAFDRMRAEHPHDARLAEHLGINYDTCHFAVEFEEPVNALPCLTMHGIKISKIHLSSALKVRPTPEARQALAALTDDSLLRQVVIRHSNGEREIYWDLRDALVGEPQDAATAEDEEWRIHCHIPMHHAPAAGLELTEDHILGVLDILSENPGLCTHLEMETGNWEVLPPELKARELPDQLAAEYEWTIARLSERGLAI